MALLNKERTSLLFWLLIIFFYSINFQGFGFFIPLLSLPFIISFLLKEKLERLFWITSSLLFAFCIVYAMYEYFYAYSSNRMILQYLLFPIIMYVLGYKLVKSEKHLFQFMMVIILGYTLFGVLSVMNTIATFGDMSNAIVSFGGRRYVLNLWDDTFISATGLNTYLSLSLSLLPVFLINMKRSEFNLISKILFLLCFGASLYCALQLGNRTALVIVIISTLVTFIIMHRLSIKWYFYFSVCFFTIVIINSTFFDFIEKISAWLNQSLLFQRMDSADLLGDSRIHTWWLTLKGIFYNPFGGKTIEIGLNYAHNLWLDVGFVGGIIPFILILIFTGISIYIIIMFLKSSFNHTLKTIVLTISIGFLLTFMVEPIIQGWLSYFVIFCFIIGMLQKQNYLSKN